jgi:hypothetical protein
MAWRTQRVRFRVGITHETKGNVITDLDHTTYQKYPENGRITPIRVYHSTRRWPESKYIR